MQYVLFLIVLIAGMLLGVIAWRMKRARTLPATLHAELRAEFARLHQLPDDARRVLEAEKILDHALFVLGYRGSFGQKLQKAGPRFSALQSMWDAHKLRNRIAHERSVTVDNVQAKRAVAAFERALKDIA